MAYKDNEGENVFDVTANEMLRRLNNQYKADKFADKYNENAEYLKAEDGSVQIDISTLSDREFKTLFDSYLATSNMNVSEMTDSTYKSLQYHIVNLQKKSGAMLLTGDEMEKRFEGTRTPAYDHGATTEIPVPPKTDIFAEDGEEEFGATTEFIMHDSQMFGKTAEDAVPMPQEEEKSEEEQLKQRRISIFEKLRALMRASATEEIPMGLETEEFSANVVTEELPDEPATEEFIIPSYIANEAIDSLVSEEETTPEEEMLENYLDDTSELEAYKPSLDVSEVSEEENESAEVIPSEEPEEFTELEEFEDEEILDEIVPEEPAEYIPEDGISEDEDFEEEEITDALAENSDEETEGGSDNIFDEPYSETEESEEEKEIVKDYVSFEQNPEIFAEYKKKYKSVRARMGISIAIAVILLVIENIGIFGIQLPEFLRNPAVLVPLEWTLIFADALLICYSLVGAAKKLVKFKFEPATVTLLAFIFATCTTFSSLFAGGEVKLFNFPFAVCVLFNLISMFLSVRKEIFTFKVISSAKKKHAVVRMNEKESAIHAHEFKEYVSETSEFYRVDETDFVEEYFAQKKKTTAVSKRLRVLIPVVFFASCVIGVVNAIMNPGNVYESLTFGYLTFVVCAPIAVFFANELPVYLSSVKAYFNNSAIIGDSAVEIMENMSAISFADSDVFKADGVRIKGVKVVGNNRIDNIIYYASSVFDIVGGPLAKVFKQAALESAETENAEIRVISAEGIDAAIDGNHILAGTEQFMETQCFRPVRDDDDADWEGKTNRRILYLACNEEIIAKFYVEYNVNSEFAYLVKKLSEAGICVSVRTNDPCVDVDIFCQNNLNPEKYPLCVIKGEKESGAKSNVSAKKSGIVAAGSVKGLVKTVLLCDRLANVIKTNSIIKAISALAGLLLIAMFIFMNITFSGVWSLYFGVYQLVCLIPVYIISKIYI